VLWVDGLDRRCLTRREPLPLPDLDQAQVVSCHTAMLPSRVSSSPARKLPAAATQKRAPASTGSCIAVRQARSKLVMSPARPAGPGPFSPGPRVNTSQPSFVRFCSQTTARDSPSGAADAATIVQRQWAGLRAFAAVPFKVAKPDLGRSKNPRLIPQAVRSYTASTVALNIVTGLLASFAVRMT
jgi:hypothetical protein